MPQLADVITKESVHRLHKAFEEGILAVMVLADPNIKEPSFIKSQVTDVGEPILRWVHHQLMASSRPNKTSLMGDYPRVSTRSVTSILREEGAPINNRFVGDVTRLVQYAGVARFVNGKWFLRDWSYANVQWIGVHDWARRPDPKVEKRIEEEADKPVTTRIDLRKIKRPTEFTPEAIGAFIDRFIPAALKLQEEYDRLRAAADQEQWQGVASKLEETLK